MMAAPEHAQAMLNAAVARSMEGALRAHRNRVETLSEQTVRDGAATGFVDIAGTGECLVEIAFPIVFLERPLFTAGLELADNIPLTWGSFPTWSATVSTWDTKPAGVDSLYLGATVAVVVAGASHSILHYRFSGRSYTPPTGAALNVGSTL